MSDQAEAPEEDAPAASSAASSTSSPYTAGPGPGIDASAPIGEPPPQEDAGDPFLEVWQEEQLRDWLRSSGDAVHAAWGVGEHDWAMTRSDLDRIAPPLTRILNRYQPTRAVAAFSDPAAVALGFGLYGWRSTLERAAVLKRQARERGEDDGAAGAPAPLPVDPNLPAPTFAEQLRATRPPEA